MNMNSTVQFGRYTKGYRRQFSGCNANPRAPLPKIGQIYKHYHGKYYRVINVGHHTETCEALVCYKALYHDEYYGYGSIWMRPLFTFEEKITVGKNTVPRFRLLHPVEMLSTELRDVLTTESMLKE